MTVRSEVLYLVWLFVMCNLFIMLGEAVQLAALEAPR